MARKTVDLSERELIEQQLQGTSKLLKFPKRLQQVANRYASTMSSA
jgi:hypothetical protein